MQDDYYALLGIPDTATATEIKRGYRDKARILHPDKNEAPNAKEVFCKIKKAYDILSNAEEKRKYDSQRSTSRILFNISSMSNMQSQQPSHSSHQTPPHYHSATFHYHRPTRPSTMRKDQNWEEIRAMSKGGEYYRKFLARMRQQRQEQMDRRRYESFHQSRYFQMQQNHRDTSLKFARLRLEWDSASEISISTLKDKINAESIFCTGHGTSKSCVANFQNAQIALAATEIIETQYAPITYIWLTQRPRLNKDPIVLDDSDEEDIEIVDEDDEDCFITKSSFGFRRNENDSPVVIDSDDSDIESVHDDEDDVDIMHVDEDIIIDGDVLILSDDDLSDEDDLDRGNSVSPNATNSPEGIILID